MDDEKQSILANIIAAPDEDGPRLVMADWLEEHGEQDHAEFIRTQIELANLKFDGITLHNYAIQTNMMPDRGFGFPESEIKVSGMVSEVEMNHHRVKVQPGHLASVQTHRIRFGNYRAIGCMESSDIDRRMRMANVRFVLLPQVYKDQISLCWEDEHEKRLRKRESHLLHSLHDSNLCYNRTAWAAELAAHTANEPEAYVFHRGFVETIRITWQKWLNNYEDILKVAPLRECHMATVPPTERVGRRSLESVYWSLAADGFRKHVEIYGSTDHIERARRCLHAEWPQIRFTLPTLHEDAVRQIGDPISTAAARQLLGLPDPEPPA